MKMNQSSSSFQIQFQFVYTDFWFKGCEIPISISNAQIENAWWVVSGKDEGRHWLNYTNEPITNYLNP